MRQVVVSIPLKRHIKTWGIENLKNIYKTNGFEISTKIRYVNMSCDESWNTWKWVSLNFARLYDLNKDPKDTKMKLALGCQI